MRGLERIAADRRHLVAQQVRVSSGFTWGRESVVGNIAAVERLRPAVRDSARWERKGQEERAAQAGQLLALLKAWPDNTALAPSADLGRRLSGLENASSKDAAYAVTSALTKLEADGHLVSISGTRDRFRGERVVLLRQSSRILRTPGAPAFWNQLVAGAV